jgi:hypothetical protein
MDLIAAMRGRVSELRMAVAAAALRAPAPLCEWHQNTA